MEDKGSRRWPWWHMARRRNGVRRRRRNGRTFLSLIQSHRNALLTGVLLIALLALLFGLFSRLQPPPITAPDGVTPLSYSAFVNQIKAGNVLAVVFQDHAAHGLLAAAPGGRPKALTSQEVTSEISTWMHTLTAGSSSWASSQTAPISPARQIYTRLPAEADPQLMALLASKHVLVTTLPSAQNSLLLQLLWHLLPFLFIGLVLSLLLLSLRNQRPLRALDERMTRMSKSRARRIEQGKAGAAKERASGSAQQPLSPEGVALTPGGQGARARVKETPAVTFADVAGIDEVRSELEEIVEFLRDPQRFNRLGARIPRGALLVGPPGTGKTLLAKAVAGEAGVPFFSISASEFVEMFVGVGASRVRDLFAEARKAAPCVIFIDEIDAVGRRRGVRAFGNEERDQTLNQLLVELDGFNEREAVIVLAATNRVDILDRALLRPGRFDRTITVSLPDRAGRAAILEIHTRRMPLHEDVDLQRLARMTTGMTGADLANLANEAALIAARRDLETISWPCFEEALARVRLGILRPLVMSEQERRVIAYHEGGHALVAYYLPEADAVQCVTILPRGQSLGVTQFVPEEDRYNYSRETLMARIAVGLGGRVAEELIFGPARVTTGAENDLQAVTDLARRMVTRWGMSEELGVIFADYQPEESHELHAALRLPALLSGPAPAAAALRGTDGKLQVDERRQGTERHLALALAGSRGFGATSTALAALIDAEVRRILHEGYATARSILSARLDRLHRLAAALLEREHLDRLEFEALMKE
jgi:ATP-dependent metalloprotease FtsH